jgi:citrate synthase
MDYSPGLEGVIALETRISFLDTEREEIVVRGYNLLELIQKKTYVDVLGLLLQGELPGPREREALEAELLNASVPKALWQLLQQLPAQSSAMDRLRTAVSALGNFEGEAQVKTVGQVAALVANLPRLAQGQPPRSPQGQSFPEAFLFMIRGEAPTPLETRVFDQVLMAYSEHELPNSTFTARVITSTLSDSFGALTGAVASLKGPLHGGANEAVMEMLLEAKTPEGLERLMREKLARKERIMGFGHRVYMHKPDPRAQILKETLKELVRDPEGENLLAMCLRGEEVMREAKGLYPNLDYYAAPVYYLLRVPIELYTPVFFAARMAGLLAHIQEQRENNRLFRPRVRYLGPRGLRVTP